MKPGSEPMRRASRTIDIDVPVEDFLDVICDFESYPEFVGSVREVEIQQRDGNHYRVHFGITLLRRYIGYTLDLVREPLAVRWQLVEGDLMKANEGEWRLIRLDDFRTRATYIIGLEVDIALPNSLSGLLTDATIPRMLRDFKRRAESLTGSTAEYE